MLIRSDLISRNGSFLGQKVLFVHLIDGPKLLRPYPHLSSSQSHHSSQGHTIALQDSFLSKGRSPWSCCFEIKLAIVVFTAHDKDKGTGQQGHTHSLKCNRAGNSSLISMLYLISELHD